MQPCQAPPSPKECNMDMNAIYGRTEVFQQYTCFFFLAYTAISDLPILSVKAFNNISHFLSVFTEKYCTANHVDKLPGPRDWVQILQDQIKLARRRLKRGSGMNKLQ